MLQYISQTSPECVLRPGQSLNAPFSVPEDLSEDTEGLVTDVTTRQQDQEIQYYQQHEADERWESSYSGTSIKTPMVQATVVLGLKWS